MRLAVLADIHGNLPALKAILGDLQQFEVNGIVVAGDIAVGPQVRECLELLQVLNCWIIRGNNENYLLRFASGTAPAAWMTSRQWALMRWAYQQTDPATLEVFRNLPEQRSIQISGVAPIRLVHGSPRNPSELIFPDRDISILDIALEQIEEPVLVCGHTHIPWAIRRHGKLALNPGGAGGPLNGDFRAQYALLNWEENTWQATHRGVHYNHAEIRQAFQKSGILESGGGLAKAFLNSVETGQNVSEDFLKHAYQLAWEAGAKDCEVVPDEIWDLAVQTFNWGKY